MKQCRLSYGTSQSDLSENYLYPFCHGHLGCSNVNIAGIFCCWIVHVVLTFLYLLVLVLSSTYVIITKTLVWMLNAWHCSATSHGKGACDGVGGTV